MTTYFVKNTGSDGANGLSDATAWKTIVKVSATTFLPGDVIQFRAGDVWREGDGSGPGSPGAMVISSSGTAGKPITYTRYGAGPNPIIDGSTTFTDWSLFSGSIYRRTMAQGTQVFENEVRMLLKASTGAMTAGSCFPDTTFTYIWCADSGNPNAGHNIKTCADGSCIELNGKSFITFDGIDTTKAQNAGYNFPTGPCNNITIQNCSMSFNGGRGVDMAFGGADLQHTNTRIRNCVSFNHITEAMWLGNGSNGIVENCEGYQSVNEYAKGYPTSGKGGIFLVCFAQNWIVQNCYAHDLWFANYFMVEHQQGIGARSTNCILRNNKALVNQTPQSGTPYGFVCEGSGTKIYRNVCIGTSQTAGRAFQSSNGGINEKFYHNVAYGQFANWAVGIQTTTTNMEWKNNITVLTAAGCGFGFVSVNGLQGSTLDYNCYFPATGQFWQWDPDSTFPNTLAAWQAKSGQDAHGINSSPLFISAANGNFQLQVGSTCKDAGILIAGINDDFVGTAPDMGAFEMTGSGGAGARWQGGAGSRGRSRRDDHPQVENAELADAVSAQLLPSGDLRRPL